MFRTKTVSAILAVAMFVVSMSFAGTLDDNWGDFLHYTKIGRVDLAKGYAQALLESEPDPVKLLALSEKNPSSFAFLIKVAETAPDTELASLASEIVDIVEQGRFIRRADPKIIVAEISRLSTTARGRLSALERLRDSGEYAVMHLLDAMATPSRRDEVANMIWALQQLGRDAIRPMAAALESDNTAVKAEIIKALGKIAYPQSLAYLKYVIEKEASAELRAMARESIEQIDPVALGLPASQLFYQLAENYYYHAESLAPTEDTAFANMWFWDAANNRLVREEVDRSYFNELMAMRVCEFSLKADAEFGAAIGLWLASYFKAESADIDMPAYFGSGHADAFVYATTAGPEYLHQALRRAVGDRNAYVALGTIEALAMTAGEKSLLYRIGMSQPLVEALKFDNKAVKYSAAIAIAAAGPKDFFPESKLVVELLAEAMSESPEPAAGTLLVNKWVAESYALRAAEVMLKLAKTRNPVVDLSVAKRATAKASADGPPEIRILAARTLAYLGSPYAQRAIAAMALNENNDKDIRVSAFESLAVSAKLNANLLDNDTIDAIYSLVSSRQADTALKSSAAAAFGALNLPSRKVKDLIPDQSRHTVQ